MVRRAVRAAGPCGGVGGAGGQSQPHPPGRWRGAFHARPRPSALSLLSCDSPQDSLGFPPSTTFTKCNQPQPRPKISTPYLKRPRWAFSHTSGVLATESTLPRRHRISGPPLATPRGPRIPGAAPDPRVPGRPPGDPVAVAPRAPCGDPRADRRPLPGPRPRLSPSHISSGFFRDGYR